MSEYYLNTIVDSEKKKILELQELILVESLNFYKKQNIHWLSAPVTTGAISSPMGFGSDSRPVNITIDGKRTYLADSMQFLLEYGCRIFGDGCWYIMPTFRGESIDKRHLKQFFHSEAEVPGDLENVMNLVDEYIKNLLVKIQAVVGNKRHLAKAVNCNIPRITFNEAEKILGKDNIEHHNFGRTLSSKNERELIRYFDGPVWVTNYDQMTVPFYQKSVGGVAKNADLLMGIGETVGCGERWANGDEVLDALESYQIPASEYDWYIKMKQEFPVQTSGFGMGIERFLLFVLGQDDIRKMQIFRRFNDGKDIV